VAKDGLAPRARERTDVPGGGRSGSPRVDADLIVTGSSYLRPETAGPELPAQLRQRRLGPCAQGPPEPRAAVFADERVGRMGADQQPVRACGDPGRQSERIGRALGFRGTDDDRAHVEPRRRNRAGASCVITTEGGRVTVASLPRDWPRSIGSISPMEHGTLKSSVLHMPTSTVNRFSALPSAHGPRRQSVVAFSAAPSAAKRRPGPGRRASSSPATRQRARVGRGLRGCGPRRHPLLGAARTGSSTRRHAR